MIRGLVAALLVAAVRAGEPGSFVIVESRWVVADPAAVVRAAPSAGAGAVGRVPWGTEVTARRTDGAAPVRVGGLEGRWVEVDHEGLRGWVFDALLVPLPPPPRPCRSPADWALTLGDAGPIVEVRGEGGATGERVRALGHGAALAEDGLGGGEIHLPGLTLDQAWTLARGCWTAWPALAVRPPPRAHERLPAAGGRLEIVPAVGRILVEETDASGATGRSVLLVETPDGVRMEWRPAARSTGAGSAG